MEEYHQQMMSRRRWATDSNVHDVCDWKCWREQLRLVSLIRSFGLDSNSGLNSPEQQREEEQAAENRHRRDAMD